MKPRDFVSLFSIETPRLIRRLRAFRGRVAAEDVVQTAFANLLARDGEAIVDPKAYLAQITRNLAVNEVRRQERAPVRFVDGDAFEARPASELTPEEMLIEGERFAHMMGAVLALPERERLALILVKLEGLSHKDVAARLGVSPLSVPRYLARALAKCAAARQAFERAGLDEMVDDKRKGEPHRTRSRPMGG